MISEERLKAWMADARKWPDIFWAAEVRLLIQEVRDLREVIARFEQAYAQVHRKATAEPLDVTDYSRGIADPPEVV